MLIVLLRRQHNGMIRLPREELVKQAFNKREVLWVKWDRSDPRVTITVRTLPEDAQA